MYVVRVEIEDIRSIPRLTWEVPEAAAAGWHVVLGDNGSGKTTFLRAIALALAGEQGFFELRQSPETWCRERGGWGTVRVSRVRDPTLDDTGKAESWDEPRIELGVEYSNGPEGTGDYPNWIVHASGQDTGRGWFCAGFGPFRRFTGGEAEPEHGGRLGRFLSLFDERFALSSTLQWLIELHHLSLAGSPPRTVVQKKSGGKAARPPTDTFERVRALINQPGFLPHGVVLEAVQPPRDVLFRDATGAIVPIEALSDGYRSALSLVTELVRQLIVEFGADTVLPEGATAVAVPGVVLIDEVDAHLHPTWQLTIGEFLLNAFPKMQFIVTTHSAFVCRSAGRGSVYLLPNHGADGVGRFLTEAEKRRLVYGNMLDALSTGAFGVVAESEAGRPKRQRLADLNTQELTKGLTQVEQRERDALRAELPTRASALGKR